MLTAAIVIPILMSPSAQRIDFRIGALHVDGYGFRNVKTSILTKILGGKGIYVGDQIQDEGADASYNMASNSLTGDPATSFEKTAYDRSRVIHECVHAMEDLTANMCTTTRYAESEAAAYIAQGLYLFYEGAPLRAWTPLGYQINLIAGLLVNRKGMRVPEKLSNTLQNFIVGSAAYSPKGITRATWSNPDGIQDYDDQ